MLRIYPAQCAWQLGEFEVKDFTVDVTNELQVGETVLSADWFDDPTGELTISTPSVISGPLITRTISTPTAGQAYNLVVRVTTSLAKVFDVPLVIGGVDKSK